VPETIRFGDFEWDQTKAIANARKHGVTFAEACEVFLDPRAVHYADLVHPERVNVIGPSRRARVLFVVYLEARRSGTLRIVTARRATPRERTLYEEDEA
jgi:uncharacterized DUF497 family protein